ncbi:MAG: N-acetylmuramoyl-L-alanine amidase [Candidatus Zipacnadales bacterium]
MRFFLLAGFLFCFALSEAQQERVVKITVANAAIRAGASTEYDRVTVAQPGIKLAVVRREGDWYRVRLGDAQEAYVSTAVCELLPEGTPPSQAKVTDISARPYEKGTRVTISISAPILFRIIQRLRPAALQMQLYNCRLSQYGVRQLEGADAILAIEQVQQTTNTAELTFHLPQTQQTGYDAYYNSSVGGLIVDVRRPYQSGELGDKLIGLDPGHGGIWSGAKGPTGLVEKDVNLDISLRLRQMLELAGARVFMTRETDIGYGRRGDPISSDLAPRRQMTREAGVDLFVSVHNNHIGSGNPRAAAGTETYYYTPMSILPAKVIQDNLCASLGTQNRFISWRPFYVLRDTDCPRVLVECCYLSHPDEEAALKTIDFRHRAAAGIFAGIHEFFEKSMVLDGLEVPELQLEPGPSPFG